MTKDLPESFLFFALYLICQWKYLARLKHLKNCLLSTVVIEVKMKKCKIYNSRAQRDICLIQCTYSCNPPSTPILVCIGIFGQYKSLFHCSQHLFCMWTLKTLLYKFTSYVKPSVMKQIFIAYQSNLQSYPN